MSYNKDDAGKLRYDLIPPEGLEELARAYTHGASHPDGARRWEQGGSWLRLFAALMRHAWKWRRGEDYDKESGLHHMASVAFYAFALATYKVRGVKGDDRTIKAWKTTSSDGLKYEPACLDETNRLLL